MHFMEVDEIPNGYRAARGILEERLDTFMSMRIKYAKVTYTSDEYSCPTSCRSALAYACRRYGFPVDVKMIGGEVYLIRRDI